MQFFDNQTYNGLFSVHASLMIFLFVIPAFAGIANFVVPLMLGRRTWPSRGLKRPLLLAAPDRGDHDDLQLPRPGGRVRLGLDGLRTALGAPAARNDLLHMGVQWAGASSIMTALNFLVTIITMRAPGMTFWRMPLWSGRTSRRHSSS